MNEAIELLIQLAFELGQTYRFLYDKAGLDNVIDFKDIAFANSRGAEWNVKLDESDLPKLFKIHNLDKDKINELNKLANDLKELKKIAKDILEKKEDKQ